MEMATRYLSASEFAESFLARVELKSRHMRADTDGDAFSVPPEENK